MRRGPATAPALLVALVAAGPAAAAEPPAALVEATEQASGLCRAVGGTPAILDGYRIVRDLNGDGRDDFLTDLARLECGGAWSAFCGPSGCPLIAWLSAQGDGYEAFDFGRLLGFEIEDGEPRPTLVARYAAAFCDGGGTVSCTRSWSFAANRPDTPASVPDPVAETAPQPEASPPEGEATAAVAAPPASALPPGWTLRRVPGASPVALGSGTGNIASLAAFCLSGQPFLAVTFHQRPDAEKVTLDFAFGQGPVQAGAGYEETAGGAFVIALGDGPLAGRLGGRDSSVVVSVDGKAEGALSLSGSTRALRGALAECGGM